MDGKVVFYYQPVYDLKSALSFYRDQLGLEESWREGEGTVTFKLPESDVQLMIDLLEEGDPFTAGPMFLIPSVDAFYAENQGKMEFTRMPSDVPPGRWAGVKGPSGNMVYFIDFSKQR